AAVATRARIRTSATQRLACGDGSGSIRSPRPVTSAKAAPLAKNGTSEPMPAPTAHRSTPSRRQILARPRRTAPASLEPPPRPAATGMRFATRTWAAAGRPSAWASARTARVASPSPTAAPMSGDADRCEQRGRAVAIDAGLVAEGRAKLLPSMPERVAHQTKERLLGQRGERGAVARAERHDGGLHARRRTERPRGNPADDPRLGE